MNDTKGLYDKYMVVKAVDGTVVTNCFILRPDKDPAAVKALQAYAAATENKALADDIYKWVGKPMLKPLTQEDLNNLRDTPIYIVWPWREEWRVLQRADVEKRIIWWDCGLSTFDNFWCNQPTVWLSIPTEEERAAAPWEE